MPSYIPPALRNNPNYKSKKLSLKPKPVDWSCLKTTQELIQDYHSTNEGKADVAWEE